MDLRDVPAVELVKEKRFVVMALPTSTLEEAMRTMTETGVTSLPVFAPDSGYLGFISFFDVMAYVAFFTHFRDATAASAPPSFARLDATVGDVLSISAENKSEQWKAYGSDETLGSIAGRMESGIHRMLIAVNDHAKLLTQTDVIRFIFSHDSEGAVMKKTLTEAGLLQNMRQVVTIPSDVKAISAFRTLYQNKITAAPIVDAAGKVVGTLSSSDVRHLTKDSVQDVMLPVLQFLEKAGGHKRGQVTVTESATVGGVFQKVLGAGVHRVWVVNAQQQPVGVVSMSNLIGLYFK